MIFDKIQKLFDNILNLIKPLFYLYIKLEIAINIITILKGITLKLVNTY